MPAAPFTRIPSIREQRGDLVLAAVMFVGAVLSLVCALGIAGWMRLQAARSRSSASE